MKGLAVSGTAGMFLKKLSQKLAGGLMFTALLLSFASFAFAESPQLPGFSLDDIDKQDNDILNLDLSQVDMNSPAAFQDVPKDHWAYKAVQRLASLGLLEGYSGSEFRGDQVVTRYELAVIVAKMLDNYNKYLQNGYIERNVPVERNWPDASEFPQPQITYTPEPVTNARTLPQTVQMKRIQEPPPGPLSAPVEAPSYIPSQPAPSVQPSSRPYSQDELQLKSGPGAYGSSYGNSQPVIKSGPISARHSGPKIIVDSAGSKPATDTPKAAATDTSKTATPPKPADSKDKSKDKAATDKSKDAAKDSTAGEDKSGSKKAAKVPKELKAASAKYELTEKDVEIFDALVKYVKDELKTMKKELSKDIAEVKKSSKKNEGDIEKLELEDQRFRVTGGASFYLHSSEVTVGAKDDTRTGVDDYSSAWFSVYSKPRKYDDLTFTTDIYGNSPRISYQDYAQSKANFKLRTMYLGPTSLSLSPLTIFGTSYTGVNSSILLNKYNINVGIGRTDASNYLYGVSLQTNFLGNPSSFLYFSRFLSFQDKDVFNNYTSGGQYGCHRVDANWEDRFYPIGSWTAESTACLPPEKNGVTSVFLNTPTKFKEWTFMGEYAHSSYFREGFNLTMKNTNATTANYANAFLPADMYKTWRPIPEKRDSDEALLAILTYNKGPINIFPLGYAKLGHNFVSRYFGLPGFDTSSLNLSVLPIKIQSLDLFIIRPTITKTEDKWKADATYIVGGEISPMFLDPSGMTSQPTIINTVKIIDRLNNRKSDADLRLSFLTSSITYYVSDKISMTAGFNRTRVALGPACVDANETNVKNDFGTQVYYEIGNGITNCNHSSPQFDNQDLNPMIRYNQDSQNYSFYWRTSQKGEYSLGYSKSKSDPKISLGAGKSTDDLFLSLISASETYSFNQSIRYRLTDVSSVQFWYNTNYYRPRQYISRVGDPIAWTQDHQNSSDVGFRLDMSF